MLKTTDTLDTVALLARSPEDLALGLDVIRVRGGDYPRTVLLEAPDNRPPEGRPWRVGLVRGPRWGDAEPYARAALTGFADRLARAGGVEVDELGPAPELHRAYEVHATIYDRSLAYYFAAEHGRSPDLLSDLMRDIIERGRQIPLHRFRGALEEQTAIARALDARMLDRFDVLVTLATGGEAPHGRDGEDRPDSCLVWTLCGVPSAAAPAFTGPDGLPFGLQVVARRYADHVLLAFLMMLAATGLVPPAPHPALAAPAPSGRGGTAVTTL
jgi:Asp-tRNA(Asn)/Glu-tRNA(Gln) amidotransferase A subunit family amidase